MLFIQLINNRYFLIHAKIMEKLNELAAYLELNQLDLLPQLKIVQQKTTLKPSVLLILVSAFLLLVSIFIDFSPLILTIVAVLIPGYFTFQTIGTKIQQQYIKYIIYWIVFGLMEVLLEPIVSMIFGSFFLIIIESVLVVGLLHPKFNMGIILYDRVIRVYVLKQEGANVKKGSQEQKVNLQQQPKPQQQQQKQQQQQQAFTQISASQEPSLI